MVINCLESSEWEELNVCQAWCITGGCSSVLWSVSHRKAGHIPDSLGRRDERLPLQGLILVGFSTLFLHCYLNELRRSFLKEQQDSVLTPRKLGCFDLWVDVGEGQGHFGTNASLYTFLVIALPAEKLTQFANFLLHPSSPFRRSHKTRARANRTEYQSLQFQAVLLVSMSLSVELLSL